MADRRLRPATVVRSPWPPPAPAEWAELAQQAANLSARPAYRSPAAAADRRLRPATAVRSCRSASAPTGRRRALRFLWPRPAPAERAELARHAANPLARPACRSPAAAADRRLRPATAVQSTCRSASAPTGRRQALRLLWPWPAPAERAELAQQAANPSARPVCRLAAGAAIRVCCSAPESPGRRAARRTSGAAGPALARAGLRPAPVA